jgi:hypothetical protein
MGYYPGANLSVFGFVPAFGTMATTNGLWIATNGSVGIGVTNPRDVLHTMGTSTSVIRIGASNAISSVSQLVFDQALSGYWHQSGYGNNPTTGARGAAYGAAMIQSGSDSGNNYEHSYMTFHTCRDPQSDGTGGLGVLYERMRINSLGYVGIGTASPAALFHVNGTAYRNGTTTWDSTSDERLKENIVLADVDRCVEIIRSVPLKHYRWKDEAFTEDQIKDRSKLGWIAQDVEKVFPKAVNTHRFAYKQVYEEVVKDDGSTEKKLVSEDVIEDCRMFNADQMYAVMYGAIQKLIAANDELVARIEALENKS